MALNLDPEFVRHILGIYGDTDLDGRTIKLLYQTWQTNPLFIKNAYNLKNQPKTVSQSKPQLAPKAQLNPGLINRPEVANDDLSGITNFSDAFRVANLKGLKQFKWKGTKANPSGIFAVDFSKKDNNLTTLSKSKEPTKTSVKNNTIVNSEQKNFNSKINYSGNNLLQETKGLNPFYLTNPLNMPITITSEDVKAAPSSFWFGRADSKSQLSVPKATPNNDLNMRISPVFTIKLKTPSLSRLIPLTTINANLGTPLAIDYNTYRNYLIKNNVTPTPEQSLNKWDWIIKGKSIRPNIFQQGGTMLQLSQDEEMKKAFILFLVQDAAALGVQIQSELDLLNYAQLLGEEGILAKYQEFILRMQGGVKAKLGSKLTYLKKLRKQ